MFGLKVKEIEQKVKIPTPEEIATEERTKQKQIETEQFNNLKSICLNCKHSFIQHYINNPHQSDPCDVICKKRAKLLAPMVTEYRLYTTDVIECSENSWSRKVLSCSDFEKR